MNAIDRSLSSPARTGAAIRTDWTREEIRWVGTYLSFPGRIDREQWVKQAGVLAAGGVGLKDAGAHAPAKG